MMIDAIRTYCFLHIALFLYGYLNWATLTDSFAIGYTRVLEWLAQTLFCTEYCIRNVRGSNNRLRKLYFDQ